MLTPDVGPRLEAAFAAAAPAFRLDDAKIWPHHIDARVCRADASCLELRLTPPAATCSGRRSRAWCVAFPAGEPADVDALLAVLPGGAANSSAPLVDLVAGTVEEAAVWGVSTATWLWVYALAPLLLGLLLALPLRWRLRRRVALHGAWLAALALLVPALGAEIALRTGLVGALDGAALLALTGLTWLVAVERRFERPLPWLLALASLLLSLAGAEALLRLGPRPPVIETERLTLPLHNATRPDGGTMHKAEALVHCALYATVGSETGRCLRLRELPTAGPWVLHLGDSMVFGSGVDAERAFAARLPALTPGLDHRNGGIPGVSIDLQLGLLQRVLALARPTEVWLHIMPGNDLEELDLPSDFCDGAPAMLRDAQGVRPRCPTPRWRRGSWWRRVLASQMPLPLAALAASSWLVRDLAVVQRRALESKRSYRPDVGADPEGYAAYLAALRATLHAAGVPLRVSLMPMRPSAYEDSSEPRRARVRAILGAAGLPVWDSQPLVDAWVAEGGEGAVFRDEPPGDIHLNEPGHQRLAEALAAQLRPAPRRR